MGQADVVGEKSLLGLALGLGRQLPSLILWGPPGTGKTTLARLIARQHGSKFIALRRFSPVPRVRAAIDEARRNQHRNSRTILSIDEIHRFNKAQQDALWGGWGMAPLA